MKRNRVVAMLMAGIMAISQPVSIYASEDNINEIQTQTEDDSGGSINEESQEISDALQEPEISNEFEAEQKQEDSTIQQEAQNEEPGNENTEDQGDFSVEDFSDGDQKSNDIAYPSDENTTKELDWSGCLTGFDNSNIKIFISCEDGTDMEKDDILSVTDMNEKELEKIASKINEQFVDSSVSTVSAFDIKRMDANNTEKENNKSYRITVLTNDVSKIKEAHLYHQIEDGSMEELTFTLGSTEKGEQKIEFVSSGGLGVFSFVNVEKNSSSESQDGVEPTDSDKEVNNDIAAEEENKENDISESKNTTPDLNVDESQSKEENDEKSDEKSDNGNDNKNDDESKTTAKADTEIKEDKDEAVTPVSIDEFHVSFVSGANSIDGKNVWNPSDPVSGHAFIYRVDYTMSGVFSTDIGAFKIELPLHILKDKDGNWADTFNCPYRIRTDNMGDDAPDFVYEVDEESNKVTIYNYKPYPTGEAGYVEVSYETAKNTVSYIDMGSSTKVKAKVYATNAASTVTAESEADEVYIDTHATIAYTQKKKPKLYKTWDSTWGEEPSDSKDYYYLVWPIRSYINKNTSSYDFYLNDTIADMGSEVVGYRFSGESGFSKKNHTDNILSYGDRYDYVLTRYSKKKADEATKSNKRYDIHNDIEAVVSPSDHVDEDTNALSSYDWYYEAPVYIGKKGEFWAEKYGIYGEYNRVESSEDISNYTLGEFESGENDTLSYLKYHAIGDGSPYTFSLADGATGTVEDALNGLYWKKNVDYNLIDDGIYIEGTKLNDDDYDIAQAELNPVVKEADFDETTYTFKSRKKTTGFTEENNITVMIRTSTGGWKEAAVYNLNSKKYENINIEYVKKANKRILQFNAGVKALQYKCSQSYYYTELNIYPEISLFRTEHIQEILKNNPEKIAVSNEINFVVSQNKKTILDRTTRGTDYVQKVTRESEIKKDVIKTQNIKKEARFEVTWNAHFKEKYIDDNGIRYIYQNNGKFYDLLPLGCDFDTESLVVSESGIAMTNGEYQYSLKENYKNTGRTLLTVDIFIPTKNEYTIQYNTSHDYNSINDYGRSLLNSIVYESGNDKIGEGLPDNGGNITDKDILKDIDPDTNAKKFAYAEARYEVNFPVAAVTGLKKQIKNSVSRKYSYDEVIHKNEKYSYKIRLTNDSITKAKDIVFFDSLENFYQNQGQNAPTISSDWKGTLRGVDVSQMAYKGAAPVIYLSKVSGLNPQDHNDLKEKDGNGNSIWLEYEKFSKEYGLEKATAIAIDATRNEDGSEFMLDEKESISAIIYMQAPSEDKSNKQDPIAYNNIFVQRTAIKEIGNEITEIPQFYHQDYTQAHYRISSDIGFKKVDATETTVGIKGITYKLTGTSDYGTVYNEERVSDKNGQMMFSNIEKGKYEISEIKCSDDWQLNKEAYVITVNGKGEVEINGLNVNDEGLYILQDEPRYHADVTFQKINNVTGGAVEGVVFKLSGTSEYDSEYTLYVKSNKIGRVSFKNIELGTYELKEVEAPDGYIKSKKTFTVKVDEAGKATIYDGDKELSVNGNGYYQIENEPYHTIRFLKSSTYGDNIYLEGAEFSLTGISDYGTSVNQTATSGKAEDGGLVVFSNLEPGTYTLRETKAPSGHYLDEKPYKVVIKKDGTFTIDGLDKIHFGKSKK